MKCFLHNQTRGRSPKDCKDCAEMAQTDDYPIPAIDDKAILKIGDKVLRPLIGLYKSWNSAVRFAPVCKLVSIDGEKAQVLLDGQILDTDASFLVKVL